MLKPQNVYWISSKSLIGLMFINITPSEASFFSDTLVVYNKVQQQTVHDNNYLVMYLIEFVQDLLFRFIGRDYYFRAIITKGEFFHRKFKNLEAFFGKALIDSFHDEKKLYGCGLFMDKHLLKHNKFFPTICHCDDYHYVFLTQDIQRANDYGQARFPFSGEILDSTCMNFTTYTQLIFLKDVYRKSQEHPDPKVRAKFQATWYFYYQKFEPLCNALLESGFDFRAIADANWEEARDHFERELQSDYYKYDTSKVIDSDEE